MSTVIPGPWDRMIDDKPKNFIPRNWVYQLQEVDPAAMGACPASVKVVDQTSDGKTPWTKQAVKVMRGTSGAKILAYISIGEAENYRAYWKHDWQHGYPSFIDAENPDWSGNYKVRFWDPLWQTLIFKQISAAVEQGFDGVYLDIIDAYEYYEDAGIGTAANLMVRFVRDISRLAKGKRSDFWIVPQNGEGLTDNESYVNAIDAIGIEDLMTGADQDGKENPESFVKSRNKILHKFAATGKPVLCVEYVPDSPQISHVVAQLSMWGYVPYTTVRGLDKLRGPVI